MTQTALLLGHDNETNGFLSDFLSDAGYTSDILSDGKTALKILADSSYKIIIVELPLRDMDGTTFITELRHLDIKSPLVVLSKNNDNAEDIKVLNAGADLCLSYPLNPDLVQSRISALIRRCQWQCRQNMMPEKKIGPFVYNSSTLELYKNQERIDLTSKENALIKVFIDNPNVIFSVQKLYELIWHNPMPDSNSIMVYINRLRQKIEDDPTKPQFIKNIRRKGYFFAI